MPTLADIVEEGERAIKLRGKITPAVTDEWQMWLLVYGPHLLAVCRAAVEAERLTAIFQRDYITAPPDADSTAWTQRAWAASGEADDAIEKLFAAVRGDAGEEG